MVGRRTMRIRAALVAAATTALVATAAVSPAGATVVGPVQTVPGTSQFNGVACASATMCVGVGVLSPQLQPQQAVVVSIVNGVPGAAQVVPGAQLLSAVACSSATTCVAVGSFTVQRPNPGAGTYTVIVPITNGVAGPAQRLAVNLELDGIACPDATTCVAVGNTSVVTITNGVVGPPQMVSGVNSLNAVACTSAASCVAVGSAPGDIFDVGVVVPIISGVPGTPQTAPGSFLLLSVACTSSASCQAVGSADVFSGFTDSVLVPIVNGIPGAAKAITGGGSIGCASASTCEVGGASAQTGIAQVTPVVNGTPGTAQVVPGANGLTGVACPSPTTCVAVGGGGVFPDYIGVVVDITVGAGSTLVCTPGTTGSGQAVMRCTATAPGGLRSIRVTDSTAGHSFTAGSSQKCGSGLTSGSIQFPTFGSDRYKVVVTDCERPNAQDTYQVRPDGTATLLRVLG